MVLRSSVLETVGKLDEQFVSYLEDINFAVRCVRAGVSGTLLPAAQCWHQGSASTGGAGSSFSFRQMTRNRKLLLAKAIPAEVKDDCRPEIKIADWLWLAMATSPCSSDGSSWPPTLAVASTPIGTFEGSTGPRRTGTAAASYDSEIGRAHV